MRRIAFRQTILLSLLVKEKISIIFQGQRSETWKFKSDWTTRHTAVNIFCYCVTFILVHKKTHTLWTICAYVQSCNNDKLLPFSIHTLWTIYSYVQFCNNDKLLPFSIHTLWIICSYVQFYNNDKLLPFSIHLSIVNMQLYEPISFEIGQTDVSILKHHSFVPLLGKANALKRSNVLKILTYYW
jgi:hypothetical protein